MSPASRDVYVHVGAPKSGTTFVQRALWAHREGLAADGVLYPYQRPTEHLLAMLDLRRRGWGGIDRREIEGSWERVAERVRGWEGGSAVLTNELLGRADEEQISRLVESVAPANVFVVYTARDLARQLVSSWQEQVKHNLAVTFEDFLSEMLQHDPDSRPAFAHQFWPLQDIEYVLSRWAKVVGHDRVSLVTVPQASAGSDTLWWRFCQACGLDPERYPFRAPASNVSLSVAEAEFFRRVNAGVADLAPRDYAVLVRKGLMGKVATGAGDRLSLPKAYFGAVQQRAMDLVEAVRQADRHVIGDLQELVPDLDQYAEHTPPAEVAAEEELPLAMHSVHHLLEVAAAQRAEIRQLRAAPQSGLGSRTWRFLHRGWGRVRRVAASMIAGRGQGFRRS